MAAQVNLLPSLKQDRLKAGRMRQLATSAGIAVIVIAVAIPVLLLVVRSGQSLALKRTQKSINDNQQKIASTPDIITMLTVQNQLAALPALYDSRVYVTKLLGMLPDVTPQNVHLTNMEIGADGSISFNGTSNSYTSVQKFFTALSQANVTVDPNKVDPGAYQDAHFTNLNLQSVSGTSGSQVSFTITGQFAPHLISGEEEHADH